MISEHAQGSLRLRGHWALLWGSSPLASLVGVGRISADAREVALIAGGEADRAAVAAEGAASGGEPSGGTAGGPFATSQSKPAARVRQPCRASGRDVRREAASVAGAAPPARRFSQGREIRYSGAPAQLCVEHIRATAMANVVGLARSSEP